MGANPKGRDANLLFWQIFPENYIKMEGAGPGIEGFMSYSGGGWPELGKGALYSEVQCIMGNFHIATWEHLLWTEWLTN